jgi:hypothetical protein
VADPLSLTGRCRDSAPGGPRGLCVAIAATCLIAGCAHVTHQIVPCPLTYSEQEQEVLGIVPMGTPREDVLKRLAEAGIKGTFGLSHRIYYCDLWDRSSGERWHMNLALLFDESGKLYRTQVAESDVAVLREDSSTPVRPASTQPAARRVASGRGPAATRPAEKSPNASAAPPRTTGAESSERTGS